MMSLRGKFSVAYRDCIYNEASVHFAMLICYVGAGSDIRCPKSYTLHLLRRDKFPTECHLHNNHNICVCGVLSNGLGVDECHPSGHINKSEAIAKRFKDDSKFTYDFSIRNQEYNASVIPVSNISSSFDTCRMNFWAAWVGCECS